MIIGHCGAAFSEAKFPQEEEEAAKIIQIYKLFIHFHCLAEVVFLNTAAIFSAYFFCLQVKNVNFCFSCFPISLLVCVLNFAISGSTRFM